MIEILLVTSHSYLTDSNVIIPQLRKILIVGADKELKTFLPSSYQNYSELATEREKRLFVSASEKKIGMPDDLCSVAKNELGQ